MHWKRNFERNGLDFNSYHQRMKFPNWWEAPNELFKIGGHCGLVAAWAVLRHFRKRTSVPNLVEACRYTKRHGVFTVSLAAALKRHGLSVSFHSQRDTPICGSERRCYGYARRLGIVAESPLDLSEVLQRRKERKIPILLFNSPENNGHFSPLLGVRNGTLILPLADGGKMPESTFIARWSDPDILRQCVIVGEAQRQ